MADVAGGEHPVDDVLAAAAGVALERHLVADEDPPGGAAGELAAALVEDLHLGAVRDPAGRPGGLAHVVGRRDRRPADLGRTVEVVEVVAEAVHPARRHVAGERRAARRRDPQARQVVAVDHRLVEVEDPLQHHRHDDERVGVVVGDHLQGRLGVEPAPQHEGRAERQAEGEVEETPGVEQRSGDHRLALGAQRDLREQDRERRQRVRRVALGALRRPGRAGREDHEPARLVGWIERRLGVVGDRILGDLPIPLVALVDPGDDPGQLRVLALGALEQVLELGVVDDRLRALALEHVEELRPGEVGVEQQDRGAELRGGEDRIGEAAVVAAHDRDRVVAGDPGPDQRPGERVRAPVEVAEAELAELVDQGDVVGPTSGAGDDPRRRRCAPAAQRLTDREQLARSHRPDDARLGQDLEVEGQVGEAAELADLDPAHGSADRPPDAVDRSCHDQLRLFAGASTGS